MIRPLVGCALVLVVVGCDCTNTQAQTCTKRCDAPPAAICIDDKVLREFSMPGTCPVDECVYASTDRTCSDSCRDGLCQGGSGAGGGAANGGGTAATGGSSGIGGGSTASGGGSASTGGGGATSAGGGSSSMGGGGSSTGGGSSSTGGGSATCTTACNTPPASTCVNGAARTYTAQGTCASGQCMYGAADLGCSFGCANGACVADPCAGVSCTAPADSCPSPTVARRYANPATCAAGTCSFPFVDMSCGFGCTNGSCDAPTCGTSLCSAVPATTCSDAQTRRQYEAASTCDGGSCSYLSLDSYCSNGCLNGSCIAGSAETYWLNFSADDLAIDNANITHFVQCGATVRYAWFIEGSWGIEDVPMSTGCGAAHIAVTPAGEPVVTWYESGNRDLRYAERTGPNQWTVEIIANAGDVGSYNDVLVDGTGKAWAVWMDNTRHQVRASRRNAPATWSDELVENRDFVWPYFNFVLGPSGAPTVAVAETNANADGGEHSELFAVSGNAWVPLDQLVGAAITLHVSSQHALELGWVQAFTTGFRRTYADAGAYDELLPGTSPGTFSTTGLGTVSAQGIGLVMEPRDDDWVSRQIAVPPFSQTASGPRVAVDPPDHRYRELDEFDYRPGFVVDAVCVPACDERSCGSDGCGGTCGTCSSGLFCAQGSCGPWKVDTVPLFGLKPTFGQLGLRATGSGAVGIDLDGSGNLYQFANGQWSSTPKGFGGSASREGLAVDSSGRVMLAWTDDTTRALKLATHDNTLGWSQKTLSTSADGQASIALTASGAPRIVLAELGQGTSGAGMLRLASPSQSSFTFSDITTLATTDGVTSSVVLDSSGAAHVVFAHVGSATTGALNLDYATNVSGSWVVSAIRASVGGVSDGFSVRLLRGAGDLLHLAFYDSTAKQLVYGSKAPGGAWQLETVPGAPTSSDPFTLVLYPTGPALVHLNYPSTPSTPLLRRRTGPGAFSTETVPQTGYGFDFAVDGTGTLQGLMLNLSSELRQVRRF